MGGGVGGWVRLAAGWGSLSTAEEGQHRSLMGMGGALGKHEGGGGGPAATNAVGPRRERGGTGPRARRCPAFRGPDAPLGPWASAGGAPRRPRGWGVSERGRCGLRPSAPGQRRCSGGFGFGFERRRRGGPPPAHGRAPRPFLPPPPPPCPPNTKGGGPKALPPPPPLSPQHKGRRPQGPSCPPPPLVPPTQRAAAPRPFLPPPPFVPPTQRAAAPRPFLPPPPYGLFLSCRLVGTGRRARSKQEPHQWYHRRLSVWQEKCSKKRQSLTTYWNVTDVDLTYRDHSVR